MMTPALEMHGLSLECTGFWLVLELSRVEYWLLSVGKRTFLSLFQNKLTALLTALSVTSKVALRVNDRA